jgi:glycosyltransferase involved in cell wall biosynthesis
MEKVSVIINGVDSGKFAMTTRAKSPSAPIRIGTVARLEPVKDHATLLQAMRVLVDKGADVQLEIIGDGSSRQSLEQLVKDLGLNDLVRFLGAQRDIPSLLAGIDIFALSSLSEGTSISILEAMAAGKPVVATAVGGNPALVHDDKNGLLVPPSDPEALAEALLWLIKDEELRLRIGKVNRNMAELKFGKSTMTRLYECLYTD